MKKNNNIVIHICMLFLCCVQSCLTLCNPMDYSLPASLVHGILQARILEWVFISSSRGSSQPKDQTQVSCIPSIGRQSLHQCHVGSLYIYVCVCVCVCVYTYIDTQTHIRTCISPNHFPIHLKPTQYCKSTVL